MQANQFTIANIAGGDLRTFRLVNGEPSKAAIKHADQIGYGGAVFDGPAGQVAAQVYRDIEERRLDGEEE